MKEKTLQFRVMAKAVMIGLLLGVAGKAYAYDFSAVCETGQTLYYNIIDAENHYVEVTYPGDDGFLSPWSGYTKPVGSLIIPSSVTRYSMNYMVTSIGSNAFYGCNLNSVTIGNNVTSIDDFAFYACSGLYTMTISNSIIQIGDDVFQNCGALTTVYYTGTIEEWCEINFSNNRSNPLYYATSLYVDNNLVSDLEIPNSVTEIKDFAFFGYRGLNSIVTGNRVISIGRSAFFYCDELTSVEITNSVVSIGNGAFQQCTNLTSLVIPNSMASIGFGAFLGCTNLTTVIMLGTTEPLLGDYAFQNNNATIYVPYESLNAYKTATNWSNYANRIYPMSYTTIPAHGENDGWHFIASPLAASTAPTEIDNMLPTAGTFDFYRFDQSETAEWQNYKATSFNLANGQGYLYANQEDVDLIFKGSFNEGTSQEVGLTYDGTAQFAGWNLVGNPFPYSATVSRSYYVMNEDGTAIEPTPLSSGSTIAACTGIMVKADGANESVTFSKATRQVLEEKGLMHIALSQVVERPLNLSKGGVSSGSTTAAIDKAIVSFNACDALEKFVFNTGNAQISIPQGGKDYAIATVGRDAARHVSTEMPINFKASKNGTYTISVSLDNVELDYLHLIDNMTGADVDLLSAGDRGSVLTMTTEGVSYTFTAKTTDYASRFRLVFSGQADGPSADEQLFAYISNGNIVINEADALGASLQVVDMTGRIVLSTGGHTQCVPTTGIPSGVYVLRLFNGDEVKTQKIVID